MNCIVRMFMEDVDIPPDLISRRISKLDVCHNRFPHKSVSLYGIVSKMEKLQTLMLRFQSIDSMHFYDEIQRGITDLPNLKVFYMFNFSVGIGILEGKDDEPVFADVVFSALRKKTILELGLDLDSDDRFFAKNFEMLKSFEHLRKLTIDYVGNSLPGKDFVTETLVDVLTDGHWPQLQEICVYLIDTSESTKRYAETFCDKMKIIKRTNVCINLPRYLEE